MAATSDGLLEAFIAQAVEDSIITRCLTAGGMIAMLYDHILTLPEEVEFVWAARPSFAKTLFLANRYIVPVAQIITTIFSNHFGEDALPRVSCQAVLTTAFLLGICSVACANCLVTLRVISLWNRDYRVAILLAVGFCVSFISATSFLISIIAGSFHSFVYEPLVHSCVPTEISPRLPGMWASMMAFEILVLLAVISNALYRPRGRGSPLRRALYRDGIFFYASLASLQSINLILSLAARPSLILSSVLCVWALATLILNRSLLNLHGVSATAAQPKLRRNTSTHTRSHTLACAGAGARLPSGETTSTSTATCAGVSGTLLDDDIEHDKDIIEELEYEGPELERGREAAEAERHGSVVGFMLHDRSRRERGQDHDVEEAWGIELGDRSPTSATRLR